jgi:hypothetical protein
VQLIDKDIHAAVNTFMQFESVETIDIPHHILPSVGPFSTHIEENINYSYEQLEVALKGLFTAYLETIGWPKVSPSTRLTDAFIDQFKLLLRFKKV